MRIKTLVATGAASALLVTPAFAMGAGGAHHPNNQSNPGVQHRPSATPGPHASAKAKRRAYGVLCTKESRKHIAGQRGTPFSQCVTAMAKAATGKTNNPARACKKLSKKHIAGHPGTPFSLCVSSAAKLLKDQ